MMEDILSKRELRRRGARANNLAADADARKTMDRLMEEVRSLPQCDTVLTERNPDYGPR